MSRLIVTVTVACAVAAAIALSGCAQPGTQVPKPLAAKLSVATGDISTTCGYAQEVTAFGSTSSHAKELASLRRTASQDAQKLAAIYAKDQRDIYQGETVGSVLSDSISQLSDCGLTEAAKPMQQALAKHS